MTAEEVDALLRSPGKSLPAAPEWRISTSRTGERRAYLPIALNGLITPAQVEITAILHDPGYLVINILAPTSVARLCLSGGHLNRGSGEYVEGPHWHPWEMNKGVGKQLPKELGVAVAMPPRVTSRDDAFVWFLQVTGIDSPSWLIEWPDAEGLL